MATLTSKLETLMATLHSGNVDPDVVKKVNTELMQIRKDWRACYGALREGCTESVMLYCLGGVEEAVKKKEVEKAVIGYLVDGAGNEKLPGFIRRKMIDVCGEVDDTDILQCFGQRLQAGDEYSVRYFKNLSDEKKKIVAGSVVPLLLQIGTEEAVSTAVSYLPICGEIAGLFSPLLKVSGPHGIVVCHAVFDLQTIPQNSPIFTLLLQCFGYLVENPYIPAVLTAFERCFTHLLVQDNIAFSLLQIVYQDFCGEQAYIEEANGILKTIVCFLEDGKQDSGYRTGFKLVLTSFLQTLLTPGRSPAVSARKDEGGFDGGWYMGLGGQLTLTASNICEIYLSEGGLDLLTEGMRMGEGDKDYVEFCYEIAACIGQELGSSTADAGLKRKYIEHVVGHVITHGHVGEKGCGVLCSLIPCLKTLSVDGGEREFLSAVLGKILEFSLTGTLTDEKGELLQTYVKKREFTKFFGVLALRAAQLPPSYHIPAAIVLLANESLDVLTQLLNTCSLNVAAQIVAECTHSYPDTANKKKLLKCLEGRLLTSLNDPQEDLTQKCGFYKSCFRGFAKLMGRETEEIIIKKLIDTTTSSGHGFTDLFDLLEVVIRPVMSKHVQAVVGFVSHIGIDEWENEVEPYENLVRLVRTLLESHYKDVPKELFAWALHPITRKPTPSPSLVYETLSWLASLHKSHQIYPQIASPLSMGILNLKLRSSVHSEPLTSTLLDISSSTEYPLADIVQSWVDATVPSHVRSHELASAVQHIHKDPTMVGRVDATLRDVLTEGGIYTKKMLYVLLIIGILFCPALAMPNRTAEAFNSEWHAEHEAIVSAGSAAAGIACLTMIVLLAIRRAGLSWIICVSLWSTVLVVGIIAWLITYQQMRVAIEDQVESLIYSIGSDVKSQVRREMGAAADIVKLQKLLAINGFLDMYSTDLAHHARYLQSTWLLFEEFHRSISFFYYANDKNEAFGTYSNNKLWIAVHPGTQFPPTWTCVADSPHTNCSLVTCGSNTTFEALNCSKTCDHPSHALCSGELFPLRYRIPSDVAVPVLGELGTLTGIQLRETLYNSMGRPWYKYSDDVLWSEPYAFVGDVPVIGLSATVGTRSPTTKQFTGVVAVDFEMKSLQGFVKDLQPTNKSSILLILDSGAIVAGTHDIEDLTNRTEDGKLALTNAWEQSASSVRKPMSALEKRSGRNIAKDRATLIHENDIAVLAQPVTVSGGLQMFAIVTIPYEDVLQKAWDASTTSLILVLVLSVCSGVLLAVCFTWLLSPIHELDKAMRLVAWMMVDNLPVINSRVSEIASMSSSFNIMVNNLIEYKQYLPQTLLIAQEVSDAEESESGKSSTVSVSESSKKSQSRKEVFQAGLQRKNITVVWINMSKSHARVFADAKGYTLRYGEYLLLLQSAARDNKGVIDTVSGDRVRVTFNAVINNAAHRMRGCSLAWDVMKCPDSRMGVSSGDAFVGNVGCKGMMKFSAFGGVVTTCISLEALAGEIQTKCVVAEITASQVDGFFEVKKLFKIHLPHEKPMLVRELITKREEGDGEWMYVLDDVSKTGFGDYNNAISALFSGDVNGVKQIISAKSFPADQQAEIELRLKSIVDSGKPEPPLQFPQWFPEGFTKPCNSDTLITDVVDDSL